MPVQPLSQWNEDFTIEQVRVHKDRWNYSAVVPPIAVITGRCKVTNTEGDRWVELQISNAERERVAAIEERILRDQPDSMSFRSSLLDGRLDAWLDADTEFYSADKVLMQERPRVETDTVVRALITLSELTYASSEFGAMWRVEQLWMPRTKFAFDEEQESHEAPSDSGLDMKLPPRGGHAPREEPKPEPKAESKAESKADSTADE